MAQRTQLGAVDEWKHSRVFGLVWRYGVHHGRRRHASFASNAGLWHYDATKNVWQGHLHNAKPGCGQALLAKTHDGKTLYWSCEGKIAAFDIHSGEWTDLWHVDCDSLREDRQRLMLSPDGTTLWLTGIGKVFAGNVGTRKAVTLSDKEQAGLTSAKFVSFDPKRRLALIGTPQGLVGVDDSGKLKFVLDRPASPLLHEVCEFEFAPDGSEVWCLMRDSAGAAVLYPSRNRWEVIPDPKKSSSFHTVAFSPDGKTAWLSQVPGSDDDEPIRGSTKTGDEQVGAARHDNAPVLRDCQVSLADAAGQRTMAGWIRTVAELASGKVTCYGKTIDRPGGPAIGEGHTIIGDDIDDLVFASHGTLAVCRRGCRGRRKGWIVHNRPRHGQGHKLSERTFLRRTIASCPMTARYGATSAGVCFMPSTYRRGRGHTSFPRRQGCR